MLYGARIGVINTPYHPKLPACKTCESCYHMVTRTELWNAPGWVHKCKSHILQEALEEGLSSIPGSRGSITRQTWANLNGQGSSLLHTQRFLNNARASCADTRCCYGVWWLAPNPIITPRKPRTWLGKVAKWLGLSWKVDFGTSKVWEIRSYWENCGNHLENWPGTRQHEAAFHLQGTRYNLVLLGWPNSIM